MLSTGRYVYIRNETQASKREVEVGLQPIVRSCSGLGLSRMFLYVVIIVVVFLYKIWLLSPSYSGTSLQY